MAMKYSDNQPEDENENEVFPDIKEVMSRVPLRVVYYRVQALTEDEAKTALTMVLHTNANLWWSPELTPPGQPAGLDKIDLLITISKNEIERGGIDPDMDYI